MAREVDSRKLWVIPHCSVCGEPVEATVNDTAYRHGFKRFVRATLISDNRRSQEDSKACKGSGQPVNYKREIV